MYTYTCTTYSVCVCMCMCVYVCVCVCVCEYLKAITPYVYISSINRALLQYFKLLFYGFFIDLFIYCSRLLLTTLYYQGHNVLDITM